MADKFSSNGINVYPCGNRNMGMDPNARLNTEYNLVSIVNRLVDMNSFCISNYTEGVEFIFNVGGYLFRINDVDELTSMFNGDNGYLYAGICVGKLEVSIDGSSVSSQFQELLPLGFDLEDYSNFVEDPLSLMDTITSSGNNLFNGVVFIEHQNLILPGNRGSNWVASDDDITSDTPVFSSIESPISGLDKEYYILPLLKKTKIGGVVKYEVPQESLVKMCTTTNGSSRSITIDDGILE